MVDRLILDGDGGTTPIAAPLGGASHDGFNVIGTAATETIQIQANQQTAGQVTNFAANGDTVQFAGSVTDYDFQVSGFGLEITDTVTGTTSTISLNNDIANAASQLQFADGTIDAGIDSSGDSPAVSVGGQTFADGDSVDPNNVTVGDATGIGRGGDPVEPQQDFSLSDSPNVVDEGGTVTYTVTTNQALSEDTTLQLATSGSDLGGNAAEAGQDDFTLSTGSVTFNAGAEAGDTLTFTLDASRDNVSEGLEGVQVSLLDENFDQVASETTGISNVPTGNTNQLTTGQDNVGPQQALETTASNDTTQGVIDMSSSSDGTLQSFDSIDSAGGQSDELVVSTIGSGSGAVTVNPTVDNTEQLFVSNNATGGSDVLTYNTSNTSGTNEFWSDGSASGSTTEISNVENTGAVFGLSGAEGTLRAVFANDAVSGDSDSINVTATGGSSATIDTDNAAGDTDVVETLSVTSTGGEENTVLTTDNSSSSNDIGNAFETIEVGGTADLDLGIVEDDASDVATRTVDAAGFEGDLTATFGTTDASASGGISATGGAGDDTVDLGNLGSTNVSGTSIDVATGSGDDTVDLGSNDYSGDTTLDGGAGTDEVIAAGTGNLSPGSGATLNNFETFSAEFQSGSSGNVDLSNLGDFENVNAVVGSGGLAGAGSGITANSVGADSNFALQANTSGGTELGFLDVRLASGEASGNSDALGFTIENNAADTGNGSGTFTIGSGGDGLVLDSGDVGGNGEAEQVNLTLNSANDQTSGDTDVADIEFTSIQDSTIESLDLNGDADVKISAAIGGSSSGNTVDAGDLTGFVDLTFSGGVDHDVTGTANDDTFDFGSIADSGDVLNGGDGDDTLSVSASQSGSGTTSINAPETSNIETVDVSLTANGAGTMTAPAVAALDASNLAGSETIELSATLTSGGGGELSIARLDNLADGASVDIKGDATAGSSGAVELNLGGSGDSQSINVGLDASGQTVDELALDASGGSNGIETLNLDVNDGSGESDTNATISDLDVANTTTITASSSDDNLLVSNVTNGSSIETVDLSDFGGGFEIAALGSTGGSVTYDLGELAEGVNNQIASGEGNDSLNDTASVINLETDENDTLVFDGIDNNLRVNGGDFGGDIVDDTLDFSNVSGVNSTDDLTFTGGNFDDDSTSDDTQISSDAFDGDLVFIDTNVNTFNNDDFVF
ncbi:hypothetical protein SAMN05216241_1068 [Limimonas halophila]|uniref:Uncharacterized protein n=1 Tax=Limimonas halophila TaxID=1082479 RepID=A0A1G7RV72_9PROT|nr:hypothetical protein [Limimonas halophila]SDG14632.1 hypothetical protein SAMN05216241_1068 [Limimonas halophila]